MNGLLHLASYICRSDGPDIPSQARNLVNLALVDFIASAFAGSTEPISRFVMNQVSENLGADSATIIGCELLVKPMDAAFVNGTMGHALDFDDSNMVLGGHPSVVLFPGILALGQSKGSSGKEILDAYVVGFEVMMSIARAINFEHYEKGWHPTSTIGTFGSVAAASKLLGLDKTRSSHAIGLTASMVSGIKANFGTMAKPLQVGEASRRGVLCALLAADGCTSSLEALEGKQGFLNVYNGLGYYRMKELFALGDGFEILRSGIKFKKYPCCGSTHAPIDAAIGLKKHNGIVISEIAEVQVVMNPRRRAHVDRSIVTNELEAKFSVQYTVAAALIDGSIDLSHFTSQSIHRSDIQNLMRLIVLVDQNSFLDLSQGCEILIKTLSSGHLSISLDDSQWRGSESYPSYMENKFNDCLKHKVEQENIGKIFNSILNIESYDNVNLFLRSLGRNSVSQKKEKLK